MIATFSLKINTNQNHFSRLSCHHCVLLPRFVFVLIDRLSGHQLKRADSHNLVTMTDLLFWRNCIWYANVTIVVLGIIDCWTRDRTSGWMDPCRMPSTNEWSWWEIFLKHPSICRRLTSFTGSCSTSWRNSSARRIENSIENIIENSIELSWRNSSARRIENSIELSWMEAWAEVWLLIVQTDIRKTGLAMTKVFETQGGTLKP